MSIPTASLTSVRFNGLAFRIAWGRLDLYHFRERILQPSLYCREQARVSALCHNCPFLINRLRDRNALCLLGLEATSCSQRRHNSIRFRVDCHHRASHATETVLLAPSKPTFTNDCVGCRLIDANPKAVTTDSDCCRIMLRVC